MLPNFFVIGANKAGTTSLHRYLDAHPEIYMSPVKEPSFWSRRETVTGPSMPSRPAIEAIADLAAYEALFDEVTDEKAVGEASTNYLQSAVAPERVRARLPDVRLVAVLRDPSDRAFSAFSMLVSEGLEPLDDFEAAIDADLAGNTWRHYIGMGRYAPGLTRWMDCFGRDRMKIFLYEDLRADPGALMRETYAFLGVDPAFSPPLSEHSNVTMVPKHMGLFRLAKSSSTAKDAVKRVLPTSIRARLKRTVSDWNRTRPGAISPEMRARLIEVYADDIDRTAELIGRDLSAWKAV